jgi:hypothetical protein
MKSPDLGTITTTIRQNLLYKPATTMRPRFYDFSIDEPTAPTAADTLTTAIRLYSTLRQLWRKGRLQEDGVVYVKVNDQFVEIKLKRTRF